MSGRRRKNRLWVRLDDDELREFQNIFRLSGIKNQEAFMRRMILQGHIVNMDLSPVKELMFLLRNATNNINQIAKKANMGGGVHRADIVALQNNQKELLDAANSMLERLAKMQGSLVERQR